MFLLAVGTGFVDRHPFSIQPALNRMGLVLFTANALAPKDLSITKLTSTTRTPRDVTARLPTLHAVARQSQVGMSDGEHARFRVSRPMPRPLGPGAEVVAMTQFADRTR